MSIRLTEQQQRALDEMHGGPPRLVDPRSNEAYVLLPLAEYEAVREIVEDERRAEGDPSGGPSQRRGPHQEGALMEPGEIYLADFPRLVRIP